MALLKNKAAPDAQALTNELIDARAAYEATRNSVIDRVVTRQDAIGVTIEDLRAENDALSKVIVAAKQ